MAITTQETAKIVADYQRAPNDTGSPEVQVALLSARITYLTEHFKSNKKDNHSRRGLLGLVSTRRKLRNYLAKTNPEALAKIDGEIASAVVGDARHISRAAPQIPRPTSVEAYPRPARVMRWRPRTSRQPVGDRRRSRLSRYVDRPRIAEIRRVNLQA